jgi:beta-glucosidase
MQVSSTVTNTSSVPGDEVVELYISHPNLDGAPIRSLVGFQRMHLEAHASQPVTFILTPREVSVVDTAGNRLVPAGPVELWLGSTQPITLPNRAPPTGHSAKFTITSTTTLPN